VKTNLLSRVIVGEMSRETEGTAGQTLVSPISRLAPASLKELAVRGRYYLVVLARSSLLARAH
jgi:hypothetical protein